MKQLLNKAWFPALASITTIFFFSEGWIDGLKTFKETFYYENALGFIVVSVLLIFSIIRYKAFRFTIPKIQLITSVVGLLTLGILYIGNLFWLQFSIGNALIAIVALFFVSGFFLEHTFWKKSVYAFVVLAMTLPVLERLQRFIGFPFRMITANVVSFILDWTGTAHVSQSTVIITENRAASIDIPCSGVTSIYTGSLFMLALFFLQEVKANIKMILIAIAFYVSLVFFNIWRVFSLTYIYGVLGLVEAGDAIHVGIGVIGFTISCLLLWLLLKKFGDTKKATKKTETTWQKASERIKISILIAIISVVSLKLAAVKVIGQPIAQTAQASQFVPQSLTVTQQPITGIESQYFASSEVSFSSKFIGSTNSGKQYSLLIVGSDSARTHHDPETCQQAIGNVLGDSEVVQVGDLLVRQLSLNDDDKLYYWYISKDKNILDYSQRVWEEVTDPNQMWVLVQVGVTEQQNVSTNELVEITDQLNSEIKGFLSKNDIEAESTKD